MAQLNTQDYSLENHKYKLFTCPIPAEQRPLPSSFKLSVKLAQAFWFLCCKVTKSQDLCGKKKKRYHVKIFVPGIMLLGG